MNNDKNASPARPVRLKYNGLVLARKGPQQFKTKSVTDALGYETLEKRLSRISIAGLRTLISKDMSHVFDTASDAFEDLERLRPPPMPRHFVPDLADASEYFRDYKAKRKVIYDKHAERVAEWEKLPDAEKFKITDEKLKQRGLQRVPAGGSPPPGGPGSRVENPVPAPTPEQ